MVPLESRSQLAVGEEGIKLLESIQGAVAPVVVIGPYRSGKSFTLNQLLGVSCGEEAQADAAHAGGAGGGGMWVGSGRMTGACVLDDAHVCRKRGEW